MANKYSESLLSLKETDWTITDIGMIIFELKTWAGQDYRNPEVVHFNQAIKYSHLLDIPTYICLLASMSNKDIEAYKATF